MGDEPTLTLPAAPPVSRKEFHFDFFGRLAEHARERPAHVILQLISPEGREEFSCRRLADEVHAIGSYLERRGVAPGDRVAILMENQPRWGVAFLAAQSAGAIVVPLDTLASAASLAQVIEHSDSVFLIASGRFSDKVDEILPLLARRLGILINGSPWDAAIDAASKESTGPATLPRVPREVDDPVAILYTGGTTGTPKGVVLTERNLYRSITDMLQVFPLSTADRVLCLLPLYHIMPLLANLLAPVCTGATVTFLSVPDPQLVLRIFAEEHITALLCVPQFYYQLQRRMLGEVERQSAFRRFLFYRLFALSGFIRRNFGINIGKSVFAAIHRRFGGRLRAFGIGGAYCNPAVPEFLADLGFGVFQAYGLTECSGLATVTPLDRNGGLSCGTPVAHVEIKIAEPDESGIGQVLVRGENIMAGYWKDREATALVLKEGWLHTGDLGFLSPAGELRITGRSKEVIVLSSGKNIFPEELEQYFQSHCPLFQEICIIGIEGQGSNDGPKLHAVIVPDLELLKSRNTVNIQLQVRNRIENLSRSLPPHKRIGSFEIRTEPLPRTTTRKLQRFRVQELAAETRAGAASAAPIEDMRAETGIERDVLDLIRRVKRGIPIRREMNLELDLGFDSLERVELLSNIEQRFRIRIGEDEARAVFTVQELLNLVQAQPPQTSESDTNWRGWSAILGEPLTVEEQEIADRCLRRNVVLELLAYLLVRFLFLCARALLRIRTKYAAELPDSSFLICPNHTSYLDTLLVPGALRWKDFRRLFFLAANKYFRGPVVVRLARMFRILPVDPDSHLVSALRLSKAGLERGLVLCVFPEGTRSIDGIVKPLQKGPAILATELALPAVPMGIRGAFEIWPRGAGFNGLHPVEISVGAPLFPQPGETAEEFNRRLFEGIREQSGANAAGANAGMEAL